MITLTEIWQAIEGRVVALIHKTEARGCRVINTGTQTMIDSTITALVFNAEVNDTDGGWAAGSPGYLYAQRDGYYLAGGSWSMVHSSSCRMWIAIRVSGSAYVGVGEIRSTANAYSVVHVATGMFWMAAGDYIQVLGLQDSGGSRTVEAASSTAQQSMLGWLMRVG
jgi:hypothetical protein